MYAGLDYRIHFEAIRSDVVCISAYSMSSFVYVIHSGMEWIFLCDKTVKQTACGSLLGKGQFAGSHACMDRHKNCYMPDVRRGYTAGHLTGNASPSSVSCEVAERRIYVTDTSE